MQFLKNKHYKSILTSVGVVLLVLVFPQTVFAGSRELVVAGWNVENLFDPADDPDNKNDDGYTPKGWARWTDKKYKVKLDHLAEVIAAIKPDILCLSEVENRKVLEDLAATLKANYNYSLTEIIHRDGGDFRGIDVAVMAKFKPTATRWFSSISGQRDVLVCDFKVDGEDLTVIANHWKSKLGSKKRSDWIRNQQAKSLRDCIDLRLKKDPSAAIIVTGDFNSGIESTFLTETAGFLTNLDQLKEKENQYMLYNMAASLSEKERATYYYAPHKQWSSLDSISVTRSMLGLKPASSWRVKADSYSVYKPKKICFKGVGSPLPYRRVRSKKFGDNYITGYSDHFAVYLTLQMDIQDK